MRIHACSSIVIAAATLALSPPAQAAGSLTRTFVSSAGVDSNPCTITAPCASFAAAYNAVQAAGIIAALDPGKYGPLTITTPVTVNGNGWATITGTAQGNAITVNAGSGNVILDGLEIDGAGAAYDGIVFTTGGSLTISNCIVKDFVSSSNNNSGTTGNGILIAPMSGTFDFTIVNTTALNNQYVGINYLPPSGSATATGAIDHVTAANNAIGIAVDMAFASGGSVGVSISNSIASNNNVNGIYANGVSGTATTTIDNDQISNNEYGISINGGTVVLSRSTITNNSQYSMANLGTTYTYQDNQIEANGNSNAVQGNALTPATAQ
jgi:hypothetical protein